MASTERVSEHSRLIALILCIFTGYLGFHRILQDIEVLASFRCLFLVTSLALAFFCLFYEQRDV